MKKVRAAAKKSGARPRRLRASAAVRDLVAENALKPQNFIMPYFVRHGSGVKEEIRSMPGQFQISPDVLVKEAGEIKKAGVRAVMLFGIPSRKDGVGSEGYDPDGIICRSVERLKDSHPDILVFCDACLCEYTDHGHCGVLKGNDVDNDATLELLQKEAVAYAGAGADFVCPSAMMDNQVAAIRKALDAEGFENVSIMSYSAKYASAFYGPFRDAAQSPPKFGDRTAYQMDMRNSREALREIQIDVEQGADIVMVKPALAYLDIIGKAREKFDAPIAAYNVSGEYSMVKAAAKNGWISEEKATIEILTAIKRAGADIIITYFAKTAAQLLPEI